MLCNITPAHVHADLGDAWFRYCVALIHQRHEQCGGHFLVDVGTLLARAARVAHTSQLMPSRPFVGADGARSEGPAKGPRVPAMAA